MRYCLEYGQRCCYMASIDNYFFLKDIENRVCLFCPGEPWPVVSQRGPSWTGRISPVCPLTHWRTMPWILLRGPGGWHHTHTLPRALLKFSVIYVLSFALNSDLMVPNIYAGCQLGSGLIHQWGVVWRFTFPSLRWNYFTEIITFAIMPWNDKGKLFSTSTIIEVRKRLKPGFNKKLVSRF